MFFLLPVAKAQINRNSLFPNPFVSQRLQTSLQDGSGTRCKQVRHYRQDAVGYSGGEREQKSTATGTVLTKNQASYSLLSNHGRHRHFYLCLRGFSAHRLLAMVFL
jgi:hypothetical protein